MIRKGAVAAAVVCLLALGLAAQEKREKPWTEWSKKDVEKTLNDSPWGQTQTTTDTSQMYYSPTTTPSNGGPSRIGTSSDAQVTTNQPTNVKYRIRWLSARPVRQALMRMVMLDTKTVDPAMLASMKNFAETPSPDEIVIAVTYEANDQRFGNVAMQAFNSATTGTLKNVAYLERNDGQRVFLKEYFIPGRDGFGARFVFPRIVREKPFITDEAGSVRFYAKLGGVELNMKFNTARMKYNDTLEY
jgi:hypothetical protein